MTLANLKPVLIVLAIGLLGISIMPICDPDTGQSLSGLVKFFSREVNECIGAHPGWGRNACEKIAREDIWIGMTEEMIIASLGEPQSIGIPNDDDPTHEEWTYRTARYGEEILHVEDGILTFWGPRASGCPTCGIKPPRSYP